MPRLFVAIRPPDHIMDQLLDTMGGIEAARWQDEAQLHLTLRFMGEVDPPLAEDLALALGRIGASPFELSLSGVGHFEKKGKVHTLWAGLAPSPALDALQARIERLCQQIGLEPEGRRFAPHITVARLPGSAGPVGDWLAQHGTLRSDPWLVGSFHLYESTLAPSGAIYDPVVDYPLRG